MTAQPRIVGKRAVCPKRGQEALEFKHLHCNILATISEKCANKWISCNLADSGDDELQEKASYRLQELVGQIDTEESLL